MDSSAEEEKELKKKCIKINNIREAIEYMAFDSHVKSVLILGQEYESISYNSIAKSLSEHFGDKITFRTAIIEGGKNKRYYIAGHFSSLLYSSDEYIVIIDSIQDKLLKEVSEIIPKNLHSVFCLTDS